MPALKLNRWAAPCESCGEFVFEGQGLVRPAQTVRAGFKSKFIVTHVSCKPPVAKRARAKVGTVVTHNHGTKACTRCSRLVPAGGGSAILVDRTHWAVYCKGCPLPEVKDPPAPPPLVPPGGGAPPAPYYNRFDELKRSTYRLKANRKA